MVDLIVLDLSLPVMGGMQVCKALRDAGDIVPIIMLTAWHEERQRVDGLQSGADDYVTKPFSLRELMARIESQLRRADMLAGASSTNNGKNGHVIEVGDLEIDLVAPDRDFGWIRPRPADQGVRSARPPRFAPGQSVFAHTIARRRCGVMNTLEDHARSTFTYRCCAESWRKTRPIRSGW